MTMEGIKGKVKVQGDYSREFCIGKGLRQGDRLACVLFILALEKAVRDSGIRTSGTIIHQSVQLLAFADDPPVTLI